MENSKTIKTVNNFYSVVQNSRKNKLTDDEKFFICNVEIELAKSVMQEFGEETAKKMANIILAVVQ